MYRVLIVEDEMLVRSGLKNSIDWKKFGMEIIAEASDGQAAWEIYQRERPDLIITDLKMPIMDGMELIAKIREQDVLTKIVILTCLDQFDLVCKALSLKVSDYIFKLDMSNAQLEAVLERIRNELDKQNTFGAEFPELMTHIAAVKEHIFKDYMFEFLYSDNEFSVLVEKLKLRLSPSRIMMAVMEIDNFEKHEADLTQRRDTGSRLTILDLLSRELVNADRGEVFQNNRKQYVILLSFSDITSERDVHIETNKK